MILSVRKLGTWYVNSIYVSEKESKKIFHTVYVCLFTLHRTISACVCRMSRGCGHRRVPANPRLAHAYKCHRRGIGYIRAIGRSSAMSDPNQLIDWCVSTILRSASGPPSVAYAWACMRIRWWSSPGDLGPLASWRLLINEKQHQYLFYKEQCVSLYLKPFFYIPVIHLQRPFVNGQQSRRSQDRLVFYWMWVQMRS